MTPFLNSLFLIHNSSSTMKVLLLLDVKKVGKKYDVKEVSDGYARNFLIPKKLAAAADEKMMKIKTDWEKEESRGLEKRKARAAKLENETFEFYLKTGEKNEVFSSVKGLDIKKSLSEKGFGDAEVVLDKPIKTIGEHLVEVNFGKGVLGKAKIIIRAQS